MAERQKRRRFTTELKAEAVKRLLDGGKGLGEVATELGLIPALGSLDRRSAPPLVASGWLRAVRPQVRTFQARYEPRAAERVAQRAPGRGLGGGAGRPQGRAGRVAAAEAREQAAGGGGRDPHEGRRFFRPGDRVSRFAFVAAERANHAVATLCRVVGASVSGFYAWLRAIPSVRTRAEAEAELRGLIGRIFAARRRAYGSPRVHAELRRQGRRHSR